MNLGNDRALWLLFAVPVILAPVYIWYFWRKTQALKILASTKMLKKINVSVSLKKQLFKFRKIAKRYWNFTFKLIIGKT